MKIVFITTELPSLKKGAPVRTYNLIKQAVLQGMLVDIISIADPKESAEYLIEELGVGRVITVNPVRLSFIAKIFSAIFQRIPPYFAEYRKTALSKTTLKYAQEVRPDIVQCELLHAYDAINPSIESLKKLIAELKEKIDFNFQEGIRKINKEFQEFFALMFGGGEQVHCLL